MRRPSLPDVALACAFLIAGILEQTLDASAVTLAEKTVAVLVVSVPLAWRTLAPIAVSIVMAAGVAVAVAIGLSSDEALIPVMAPLVAVYSIGLQSRTRDLIVGVSVVMALLILATALDATPDRSEPFIACIAVLVAAAVGRAVREMGFEADELPRQAVAEERARIARELHDVIGHSIAVMGVQAGAVRRVLAPEQEREREMLLAVERTGRDAVAEMRRLLDFLREDDEDAAVPAPPTLARADALVADMRRAGLEVELEVDGEFDDLPPGRALAAFRILQEALTNSLKHAPGSHVRARLRRTASAVEIEVADDGNGAAPQRGGGHGLVGMRERVALYEGTLEAGPRPEGGFATVARLPVEASR